MKLSELAQSYSADIGVRNRPMGQVRRGWGVRIFLIAIKIVAVYSKKLICENLRLWATKDIGALSGCCLSVFWWLGDFLFFLCFFCTRRVSLPPSNAW